MLVIPAIDLLKGEVVRLFKGRKNSYTLYSSHPEEIALRWKEAGAELIHVVDLDAAFGEGDNFETIQRIMDVGVAVQVGGGIRDLRRASRIMKLKVKRFILGTKATDEQFLETLLGCCPASMIGVSVDVLEGRVMTKGWQEKTELEFLEFVRQLAAKRIEWFIYTDISRDGTLKGANIAEAKKLETIPHVHFMLSGGIKSLSGLIDIKKKLPFLYGVIMGKALYENLVDLKEAISSLK